mmetsp:Transcript_34856/g.35511  ORF Transcript_34856/g.35511 Transcript_34856/m.35511 type:complete len:83 (-) Transcript_34856:242-490(-)
MSRAKGLSISLTDLRIAKLGKKVRQTPCRKELEDYLDALSQQGEGKVPLAIGLALSNCMSVSKERTKPASIQFHLSKFVNRK